jgi:hypothetical protein
LGCRYGGWRFRNRGGHGRLRLQRLRLKIGTCNNGRRDFGRRSGRNDRGGGFGGRFDPGTGLGLGKSLNFANQLTGRRKDGFGGGRSRLMSGGAGFQTLLDAFFEDIDLFRFQAVQLTGDSGKSEFFTNVNENLAFKVQFLGQGKHPDLFVFFGLFFRLRIRQAELLWECDEQLPNLSTSHGVGVRDRPVSPRISYILIPPILMKRGGGRRWQGITTPALVL